MKAMRIVSAIGLAAALWASAPGCNKSAGDASSASKPSEPGASDTGSVGLQLSLPSGQDIPVISWAITGPNGTATLVQSGTADSNSLGVTFLIGSLRAGSGYMILLSGTGTDGSVTCTGSASFSVMTRVTTPVAVELACSIATSGARVTLINGTTFNCAAWNDVSASPTEATVGSSVNLAATATGPSPSALTYSWSASSGTFGNPTVPNTSFTCTSVGSVAVTLTVGDGPVPAGSSCNTMLSTRTLAVQCDAEQTESDAGDGGGGSDGGPPPPAAPALPPWGLAALVAALLAMGTAVLSHARKSNRLS
jgi:hypothetical protein